MELDTYIPKSVVEVERKAFKNETNRMEHIGG
jgi:hypothetical protein